MSDNVTATEETGTGAKRSSLSRRILIGLYIPANPFHSLADTVKELAEDVLASRSGVKS